MSKFNTRDTQAAARSPITTEPTPTATTYEGGRAYTRDTKSELFLLAVSNMVGENTFYESATDRDNRYTALIRRSTIEDCDWTARFLRWLRSDGNMRSASLVGAAEYAKAFSDGGFSAYEDYARPRAVVNSVLQRPDEPGEMLAYWTRTYGRALPQPIKRGVADAVRRMYNERNLIKYDTATKGFRFGDVLELTHAKAEDDRQSLLFAHALDRRHGRKPVSYDGLPMLASHRDVMDIAPQDRAAWLVESNGFAAASFKAAGMTWEQVGAWLNGSWTSAAWEAIIPSMGYMALLRNLRNFDQAGVSDQVANQVMTKLADPAEVAKSRQFPFRFFSAYLAAPSLRWGYALEQAMGYATQNVPEFPGRTLVLIDTSASMTGMGISDRSKMTPAQIAALFGVTLACRGNKVDVYGFADRTFHHPITPGASVLKEIDAFTRRIGEVGHGTNISGSVQATFRPGVHDRVIILTDMQTMSGWGGHRVSESVPANVPIYGFNLVGYKTTAIPSGTGTRHELGGLTDHTFRMIPLLEAGRNADWPF